MKRVLIFLLFVFTGGCSNYTNPLIGHWKIDLKRTLASTEKGSKPYLCFQKGPCGQTELIFTRNTTTAITYTRKGNELMRHSTPYKIISITNAKVEIELPKEGSVIYEIHDDMIYHTYKKLGFTEYYQLQK
ncbi:hypothetical protein SOPP22_07510 [Shewanella sp. OPT22]|nr:hypothetical protein SOPP22_07510 [Shewanella sp. OPT22]